MRRLLTLCACFVVTVIVPAPAQAPPPCDGDFAVVRVSQIKPTGSLAAFLKAQDAHIAWYRKYGFTNNQIYTTRVVVTDPKTQAMMYSETEVMSFHVRPPDAIGGKPVSARDQAGWDAYVKQYRDVADLKTQHIVCLPRNR